MKDGNLELPSVRSPRSYARGVWGLSLGWTPMSCTSLLQVYSLRRRPPVRKPQLPTFPKLWGTGDSRLPPCLPPSTSLLRAPTTCLPSTFIEIRRHAGRATTHSFLALYLPRGALADPKHDSWPTRQGLITGHSWYE